MRIIVQYKGQELIVDQYEERYNKDSTGVLCTKYKCFSNKGDKVQFKRGGGSEYTRYIELWKDAVDRELEGKQ